MSITRLSHGVKGYRNYPLLWNADCRDFASNVTSIWQSNRLLQTVIQVLRVLTWRYVVCSVRQRGPLFQEVAYEKEHAFAGDYIHIISFSR